MCVRKRESHGVVYPSVTWVFISILIWSYNGQYRDVLLHSANYVTSAAQCRQPRSTLSSPWCYPCWTTATPYWLAFRPIVRRLESVQNAAARLIYHMRSADHITDAVACLHWLRVPERIEYKIAVLTYKVLHGSAPRHLGPLVPTADLPGRQTLRSDGTSRLMVPPTRRSTVGDRAFTVAGPRVWNTLPEEIR